MKLINKIAKFLFAFALVAICTTALTTNKVSAAGTGEATTSSNVVINLNAFTETIGGYATKDFTLSADKSIKIHFDDIMAGQFRQDKFIQFRKKTGYINNVSAFKQTINTITLDIYEGKASVYAGTTLDNLNAITGSSNVYTASENAKFFKIQSGDPQLKINSVTIDFKASEPSVELDDTTKTAEVGVPFTLSATLSNAGDPAPAITWTSSVEEVATVVNGEVNPLTEGDTVIKASITVGDATYEASCNVHVIGKIIPVEGLTLNHEIASIKPKDVLDLVATVTPDNATDQKVLWESSEPAVATVDNGKVTALKDGTTTITATSNANNEIVATCVVTVETHVENVEFVDTKERTLEIGSAITLADLELKFTPENSTNKKVTWESSEPTIAEINQEGTTLTGLAEGQTILTVTTEDGSHQATITVNVVKPAPIVVIKPEKFGKYNEVEKTISTNFGDIAYYYLMNQQSKIQFKSGKGWIKNSKAFTNEIQSITITNNNKLTIKAGVKSADTEVQSGADLAGKGYKFFEITTSGTGTATAITINFVEEQAANPLDEFKALTNNASLKIIYHVTGTKPENYEYHVHALGVAFGLKGLTQELVDALKALDPEVKFQVEFTYDGKVTLLDLLATSHDGSLFMTKNKALDLQDLSKEFTFKTIATVNGETYETQLSTYTGTQMVVEYIKNHEQLGLNEHDYNAILTLCNHNYVDDVVEPTCTTPGYTLHTCTICGHSYKDTPTDALGHTWGEVVYSWNEDHTKLTATRECSVCHEKETETVDAKSTNLVKATCTTAGSETFTSKAFTNTAFKAQQVTIELPINDANHKYGEVIYEWTSNDTVVTAKRVCEHNDEHVLSETNDKAITMTVDVKPSCTTVGKATLTYVFRDTQFGTATKTVEVPALGHTWGEVVYSWNETHTKLTATRTCETDPKHVETETVDAKSTHRVEPTCTTAGSQTFTSEAFTNTAFEAQEVTIELAINPENHSWNDATYEWTSDNSSVTATRTCKHDSSHTTQEVSKKITVEHVKLPTCTEKGQDKLSYVFGEGFGTATKLVDVDALGHEYGVPSYVNNEEALTVTATVTCTREGCEHTVTETAKYVEVSRVPATYVKAGSITYKATFKDVKHFSEQTLEVAIPMLDPLHQVVIGEETLKLNASEEGKPDGVTEQYVVTTNLKAGQTLSFLFNEEAIVVTATGEENNLNSNLEVRQARDNVKVYLRKTTTGAWEAFVGGFDSAARPTTTIYYYNTLNWATPSIVVKNVKGELLALTKLTAVEGESGWYSIEVTADTLEGLTIVLSNNGATPTSEITVANPSDPASYYYGNGEVGNDQQAIEGLVNPKLALNENEAVSFTDLVGNEFVLSNVTVKYNDVVVLSQVTGETLTTGENNNISAEFKILTSGTVEFRYNFVTKVLTVSGYKPHDWAEVTYEFGLDDLTCTATKVDNNDNNRTITETVDTVERVVDEASCGVAGSKVYDATFTMEGAVKQTSKAHEIPALEHNYGDPVYSWNQGLTECKATRTCANCGDVITVTAKLDTNITKAATCTETGLKTITATFAQEGYETQIKENVEIPALGHNYGAPVYSWNQDLTECTATKTCTNKDCNSVVTETAVISSEITRQPSCTQVGLKTITATFTKEGFVTQTKVDVEIPMVAHQYEVSYNLNEVEGVWTATAICKECKTTVTEEGVLSRTNTTEGTIPGLINFDLVATFPQNPELFATQTKKYENASESQLPWLPVDPNAPVVEDVYYAYVNGAQHKLVKNTESPLEYKMEADVELTVNDVITFSENFKDVYAKVDDGNNITTVDTNLVVRTTTTGNIFIKSVDSKWEVWGSNQNIPSGYVVEYDNFYYPMVYSSDNEVKLENFKVTQGKQLKILNNGKAIAAQGKEDLTNNVKKDLTIVTTATGNIYYTHSGQQQGVWVEGNQTIITLNPGLWNASGATYKVYVVGSQDFNFYNDNGTYKVNIPTNTLVDNPMLYFKRMSSDGNAKWNEASATYDSSKSTFNVTDWNTGSWA